MFKKNREERLVSMQSDVEVASKESRVTGETLQVPLRPRLQGRLQQDACPKRL